MEKHYETPMKESKVKVYERIPRSQQKLLKEEEESK